MKGKEVKDMQVDPNVERKNMIQKTVEIASHGSMFTEEGGKP